MNRPRIVLAAPASGSGKTMVTCGILQALMNRGMKVSSFKCGPDYIDPLFHEKVIGTKSGNLDLFFSPAEQLRQLFCRNAEGTDISVVEGVMGYYDGMAAASTKGSSYEVAKAIDAPVVLIVNAAGQSVSALAALKGFLEFVPDSRIRGVIFNQMTQHVFEALKSDTEKLGVIPLGYVPKAREFVIESRHLGLVTPDEIENLSQKLQGLASMLEETLDLDALIGLAQDAPQLLYEKEESFPQIPGTRIAVARDEAFSFLYRDNLSLLEDLGAELLYFSPIHDGTLPAGTQGILLPGGYPELYAEELSRNEAMKKSVAEAIAEGIPCMAECGGFMYLHREMEDMSGNVWPMAGVIDGKAYRTKRLGRFGYVTLNAKENGELLRTGEQIRAHEFHYFDSESCGESMTAVKPITGKGWDCIHSEGALIAGFPHLYYRSAPQLIVRFLERCAGKESR